MCGVNGIFAYHHSAQAVDQGELLRTRDEQRSRGPDGAGLWTDPDRRMGLGHRRLKIIDLSDAAAQPMVSTCGRYVISYNGEIYNYRELRQTLVDSGAVLKTHCDTEVVLELVAREGQAALARLRGMFALAIFDQVEQRLLLARDPFGIKPLYLADDGWTLRFASQVRALRAGGAISDLREPAGQAGFLLTGSIPEPWTLWQEIRCLPAGHCQWWSARGPEASQPIPAAPADATPADATLADVLDDSVRAHLTADVPVAVFLSAGIDSAVLAAMASRHLQHPLTTITVGFEEYVGSDDDERPLAGRVAAALGTRHLEYGYSRSQFDADLPRIMAAMDQPSIDGVNSWIIAKACADHGIKTALSGLGADELFGGYPSFVQVPRWRRLARPLAAIPGLGAAVRRLADPLTRLLGLSPKAAGLLEYGGSMGGAWLLKRGLFMPWELPRIMGADTARLGLQRLSLLPALNRSVADVTGGPRAAVAALEQRWYLRHQLLRDADWAGMDHSVEIRVPYVDRRLHQLAGDARYSKADLLGVARTRLPDAMDKRPKTGFTTPLSQWRGLTAGGWARGWARELSCRF